MHFCAPKLSQVVIETMDNDDETNSEAFIASIQNLPLVEQNRLLKERVEFIEKANQREMDEINRGYKTKLTTGQGEVIKTVDNEDNLDIEDVRKDYENKLNELASHCKNKASEAIDLAQFCVSHYRQEKKESLDELNARLKKAERLKEVTIARLETIDEIYQGKVEVIEHELWKAQNENYLIYQLMYDEMQRRIGEDNGGNHAYSQHMFRKKMLERNIIRHNQELMSTEEGKSSTSSSCTAYIVEALKRDVDRLEQVVDSFFFQTKDKDKGERKNNDKNKFESKDTVTFFSESNELEEDSDDDFLESVPHLPQINDPPVDLNAAARFTQLNVDTFYANLGANKILENKKVLMDGLKMIERDGVTQFVSDQSDVNIVDGDEVSLSDFSI